MEQSTPTVVGHSRIESRILVEQEADGRWAAWLEGEDERYLADDAVAAVSRLAALRTGVHMGINWDKVPES